MNEKIRLLKERMEAAKKSAGAKKSTESTALATLQNRTAAKTEVTKVEKATVADAIEMTKDMGVLEFEPEVAELLGSSFAKFEENFYTLSAYQDLKFPEIRRALETIRSEIETYPELANMLKPEQIHIIVDGSFRAKNKKLVEESAAKKKSKSTKPKEKKLTKAQVAELQEQLDPDDL